MLAPSGSTAVPVGFVPGHSWEPVRLDDLRSVPPGALLLPLAELSADQVVTALLLAAEGPSRDGWLPLMVEEADGAWRSLPMSVGWPAPPEELARWANGEVDADVFELRHLLVRVARARHDINNPLTSAMAETQLVLMDAEDPALRAGLETVEEQLRRIRDLVADLRGLRPPD